MPSPPDSHPGASAAAWSVLVLDVVPRLLCLLLLGPALVGAAETVLLVGDDSAGRGVRVARILGDLHRGDLRVLGHLDRDLLLAPIGVPGSDDLALLRRWTEVLRERIEALQGPARDFACRTLQARLGEAATVDELTLACLPAPLARERLRTCRDRALDRGHGTDFLAWNRYRPGTVPPVAIAVARALAALPSGEDLGAGALAADLGPLQEIDRAVVLPGGGGGLRLACLGDLVVARDALGRTVWQRRLPAPSTVQVVAAGLLVRSGAAVWLLDPEGACRELVLPTEEVLLDWTGQGSVSAQDVEVRWRDASGQLALRLVLPEPPVTAPLQTGRWSWHLTGHWLLVAEDGQELARLRHDLDDAPAWRFGRGPDGPVLVHGDGRILAPARRSSLLDGADPDRAVAVLLACDRPAEALQTAGDDPILRARVWAQAPELIDGAALAVLRQLEAPLALHAVWAASRAGLPGLESELARLAARWPGELLPVEGDPRLEPASWSRLRSGAGLLRADPPPVPMRIPPGVEPRIDRVAVPAVFALVQHERFGAVRVRDGVGYRVHAEPSGTVVDALDLASGQLLWRSRWATPDSLPSRQLAWRDGWLLVVEGLHRLHLLAPEDGRRVASHRLAPTRMLPSQLSVLDPQRLAVLTPLGLRLRLHLLDGTSETVVELPASADWALPWDGGVLVRFADGTARRYPGGLPVPLPEALRGGGRPQWTAAGLVLADGRRLLSPQPAAPEAPAQH